MKIFINSLNRAESITTPALLEKEKIPYTIILHNDQELEKYNQAGRIGKHATVIVANQPIGMVNIRNWLLEELVKEGDWYLILDDNIEKFTAVNDNDYFTDYIKIQKSPSYYRRAYDTEISIKKFLEIVEETRLKAVEVGANLAGFASNTNFYFRAKKWRKVGYVIGKTQIIKKTKLRYDQNVFATDDYLWTAQNLECFGKVLINNFAVAIKQHYAPGGIGPYDQRLKWKLKDLQYIMSRWKGLYRYKIKKDHHKKSEIQLRFTDTSQIRVWRKELKEYLKINVGRKGVKEIKG